MENDSLFAQTRERVASAQTPSQLRKLLLDAAPMFHRELRRRNLNGERPDLVLHVETQPGRFSGIAVPGPRKTHVFLKQGELTTRRRYTLAHELGHALLVGLDRERIALDRASEDDICEMFAQRALMPPDELHRYFSIHGFPQSRDALEQFRSAFKVGVKTAIKGLSTQHRPEYPIVVIFASRRRHGTRSSEAALRIDAASAPKQIFAPYNKRLQSLGLGKLMRWTKQVSQPGVGACAGEQRARLPSGRAGIAEWVGPARWSAWTISDPGKTQTESGDPALLLMLDTSRLTAIPTGGLRRSQSANRSARAPSEQQGRLGI